MWGRGTEPRLHINIAQIGKPMSTGTSGPVSGPAPSEYHNPADLAARAADTDVLLVLCDFDGCLAELAAAPELVVPDRRALMAIAALVQLSGTYTGVVSGRSLSDLRSVCPLRAPVALIGSHGAEFDSDLAIPSPVGVLDAELAGVLGSLIAELSPMVAALLGARLEVKPASLAVHVRQVPAVSGARLLHWVEQVGQERGLRVMRGKAVVELMLSAANKGDAVVALAAQTDATSVVYVGDDVTDEDAFAVLGVKDVTVKVGSGPTIARYRLAGVSALSEFLMCLVAARESSRINRAC